VPFVEEPVLEPGERVGATFRASRTDGVRGVPGKLWVTTTYLRFRPHLFSRGPRGHALDWRWSEIASIDLSHRTFRKGPFAAGLRRRVRVRLIDGHEELFFVRKPHARSAQLRRIHDASRPGEGSAGSAA
jgi:hypothetical protein